MYNPSYFYAQPPRPQYQVQPLNGRMVSGIDEVRAAQITFDGTETYFPCPAANMVYSKRINLTTGAAEILQYKLQPQEEPKQYAETGAVATLAQRIERIENYLQGVTANAKPNAAISNDTGSTKPDGGYAANGRE